jgi:hypothetical protein
MTSSGMLCHVAFIRTEVSQRIIASIIRVKRIGDLGTTLVLTSKLCSVLRLLVTANVVPSSLTPSTPMMDDIHSSEESVLITATRRNIPEDDILHSHRRENLKSYIALTGWTL